MNRDQTKLLLPILTAYAAGKPIQFRGKNSFRDYKWSDSGSDANSCLAFDPNRFEYRIKPEPEVVYVVTAANGSRHVSTYIPLLGAGQQVKKFLEVQA